MYCLWNGEYGEHDLSFVPSLDNILHRQEEQYAEYVGCVVGDFTCLKVEYDWGKRDQRWTVKCNECGEVKYKYHVREWRRGKGSKTTCDCKKLKLEEEYLKRKAERVEKISQNKKERIGSIYNGWRVIEHDGIDKCKIECCSCGKKKSAHIVDVLSGDIAHCSHREAVDYKNDNWIGKKNGHLTVVGRDGAYFIAQCDCGNKISVKPTFLFTYKSRRDCGASDCPYSTPLERRARERRENGLKFESDFEKVLRSKGYNAKKTQNQSDYGVDIVIYNDDGSKIAVQCKKQTAPAGVNAVQEVYAGGRYYDCDKFAVVCEKGFSIPAINMAKKLGVYLCDGEFDFPQDMDRYADSLLPTRKVSSGENNKYQSKSKRKKYCIRGYTGTISEVCRHYGVLDATVRYRINNRGMTLEEAIFA